MENQLIKNKKILIGITGSISVYKIAELIRLYIKSGAIVRVIMTQSAIKFINPLTFEALTRNRVITDESESWASDMNHIDIGKWADIFIIAPATANTINKLSNGIADNFLLQTALAYPRIKLIAPAANTNMIQNPITVASLKMLKLLNYKIVEPESKLLACGDEGNGALADVNEIYHQSVRELLSVEYWRNRRVVISGGGSVEKIDEVRYISNFSSGKMAESLALGLYYLGANICLVSSKKHTLPQDIHTLEVLSAEEYKTYLDDCLRVAKKGVFVEETSLLHESKKEWITKTPYLFMVAAISDYRPKYPQDGKLKKVDIGESWSLELTQNIDVLKSLNKDGVLTYGFKAEMDENSANQSAKKMLHEKALDGVFLNILKDSNSFGADENAFILFRAQSETKIGKKSKLELSLEIGNLLVDDN